MKQKCILSRDSESLVIKEVAQTEPGNFSLVYETKIEEALIKEALDKGSQGVIEAFRTHHFYPNFFFAEKIAEGIATLFADASAGDSLEVKFNDLESLQVEEDLETESDKIENEKELAEIDKLLDDDDTFDIEIDSNTSASDTAKVNIDESPEV